MKHFLNDIVDDVIYMKHSQNDMLDHENERVDEQCQSERVDDMKQSLKNKVDAEVIPKGPG